MAAPNFVGQRYKNGTEGMYRLVSGSFALIGTAVTQGQPDASSNKYHVNKVIEFKGDLFCITDGDIRKYNTSTTVWDIQFTTAFVTPWNTTGLQTIYTEANGLELIIAGFDSGTTKVVYTSSDGASWTLRATPPSGANSSNAHGSTYVFRNRFWWFGGGVFNAGGVNIEYDRVSDSWTSYIFADASLHTGREVAACIYRGRFMLVAIPNTANSSRWRLMEFSGGSVQFIQDIGLNFADSGTTNITNSTGSAGQAAHINSAAALYERAGNLYCIFYGYPNTAAAGGSWASKLAGSITPLTTFTETDLTSAMIPGSLKSTNVGGTNPATSSMHTWTIMKDTDTDPSSAGSVVYYLGLHLNDSFITLEDEFRVMLENGDSAVFTQETTTGGGFAPPFLPNGGGAGIWTDLAPNIEIIDQDVITGGIRLHVSVYDDGGGQKNAKFRFDVDSETPFTDCTLFGTPEVISTTNPSPPPAPTLNTPLNRIEGLTADEGQTVYGIPWNTGVSGDDVPSFQNIKVKPSLEA